MIPYLLLNGFKLAPFKIPAIDPYGPFANTTGAGRYNITQTVTIHGITSSFVWPSSEHAFHAQKILYLKRQYVSNHPVQHVLDDMLREILQVNTFDTEYLPREHYDGMVTRTIPRLQQSGLNVQKKFQFDALCGADYHPKHKPWGQRVTLDFMREVIRLKLEQHPTLRATAIECAKKGIFPVEISRKDWTWASGVDGKGENMLGIIILEQANAILRSAGGKPAIEDPLTYYAHLKSAAPLSHDFLEKHLKPGPGWKEITTDGRPPQGPAPQATDPTAINLEKNGSNGTDHYFIDRHSRISLVIRPGGHHFTQNRKTINVPPQYEQLMLQAYAKIIAASAPKHTAAPTEPHPHNNGTDGGHHTSQNKQASTVHPLNAKPMEKPVAIAQQELKKYYQHSNFKGSSRWHWFTASTGDNQPLTFKYSNLKGDALKSRILMDFKLQLEGCTNKQELDAKAREIKASDAYKILTQSQGIVTSFFKLKTSSVIALDDMISDLARDQYNLI